MTKRPNSPCTHRPLRPKELHISAVDLDQTEFHLLQVARWFFNSYASQGLSWVRAFVEAEDFFGRDDGPRRAYALLTVLQVMRRTRQSTFQFSNPSCPDCAMILTEVERRLFLSLAELRQGRLGRAQAELMMLCEGNLSEDMIVEVQRLAELLPERAVTHPATAYLPGVPRYV